MFSRLQLNTSTNRKRNRSQVTFEAMEPRELFCASPLNPKAMEPRVQLQHGILRVCGREVFDDVIDIFEVEVAATSGQKGAGLPFSTREIRVQGSGHDARFPKTDVDRIDVYGFSGDDTLRNWTDVESVMFGGEGHDELRGGAGEDRLYGGPGNDSLEGNQEWDLLVGNAGKDTLKGGYGDDRLYGGDGDDDLQGGPGFDRLVGDAGNDLLEGDDGNDTLIGGEGHDRLFGGYGQDDLTGGSGNDALWGGHGMDDLTGNSGADRYLIYDEPNMDSEDEISYKSSADVEVFFKDGASDTLFGMTYTSGSWSYDDIVEVDEAFAALVGRTNNNTLLRTEPGRELKFYRLGENTDQNSTIEVLGVNYESNPKIKITEAAFQDFAATGSDHRTSDDDRLHHTIWHEIAHEWDTRNGNYGEWKDLSGWSKPLFGSWQHDSNADFVSDYAKTNPEEDFAETFAFYFANQEDEGWDDDGLGVNGPSDIQEKYDFVNDFLDSITS